MHDIVCHLGLHKTASGTLQRQFFPACPNVNLLTTYNATVQKFVQIVACKDPLFFDADAARTLLERELHDGRVNLLSNESLSGPPYAGVVEWGLDHRSPVLRNLHTALPQARVVIVLRRQDSLARSLYRQYVKRGGTATITRFYGVDGSGRPGLMSTDRFTFSPFVRLARELFDGRLLVLPFEAFVTEQRHFLQRLCGFIGTAVPDVRLRAENVTSLGPVGMDVTRRMNYVFRGMLNRSALPGVPVRRRGQWREVGLVELVHDHWPGRPHPDSSSTLARIGRQIWEQNRDDNRQLDGEFGLDLQRYGYY